VIVNLALALVDDVSELNVLQPAPRQKTVLLTFVVLRTILMMPTLVSLYLAKALLALSLMNAHWELNAMITYVPQSCHYQMEQ